MQETGSLCSPWMVQPALLITCPANPGAQHQLTLNTHLHEDWQGCGGVRVGVRG